MNNGHDSEQKVKDQISKFTTDEVNKVQFDSPADDANNRGTWTAIAIEVGRFVWSLLIANCDGPVAGQTIIVDDHWSWLPDGSYTHTQYYPGIDSDTGCGDNSEYHVTWTVRRQ